MYLYVYLYVYLYLYLYVFCNVLNYFFDRVLRGVFSYFKKCNCNKLHFRVMSTFHDSIAK